MIKAHYDDSIFRGLCEESADCKILNESKNHVEKELVFQDFFENDSVKLKMVEDQLEDLTTWKVFDENEKELSYVEIVQLFALANLKRQMKESCTAE
jgi:hypothetical protein